MDTLVLLAGRYADEAEGGGVPSRRWRTTTAS